MWFLSKTLLGFRSVLFNGHLLGGGCSILSVAVKSSHSNPLCNLVVLCLVVQQTLRGVLKFPSVLLDLSISSSGGVSLLYFNLNFFNVLFIFETETEREQGRGREWARHRIQSRLQVLSCQHKAQCRARTHKPWDHDLSQSQTLNRLGHPGAPTLCILKACD